MTDIFISYSRKDIAFARLLHQSIKDSGLDSWIDWERIPVGERWWSEIQQAIEHANLFMFIISKHSVGSDVCKDEINIALRNNKKIVPIVIDNVAKEALDEFIPDLRKIQWIIFKHGDTFEVDELQNGVSGSKASEIIAKAKRPQFDEAIQKLNVVIHTDWDWVKYHTQLQNEAHEWENNQKHPSYLLRGEALEKAEQFILAARQKEPAVTSLQADFITVSRMEEKFERDAKLRTEKKSSRRLRWVIGVVAAGLVVAVFMGINWLNQSNRAQKAEEEAILQRDEARQQAQIANSRQLAVQSIALSEDEFSLPALLGIEGLNINITNESKSALLSVFNNHPRLLKMLNYHTDQVDSIVYSTDGKLMITGGGDGSVGIWDVSEPSDTVQLSEINYGENAEVHSLAINAEGSILAVGMTLTDSEDQTYTFIHLMDITNLESPKLKLIIDDSYNCGIRTIFNPDGQSLVSSCNDYKIKIWNLSDPERPKTVESPIVHYDNFISSLVFSPDGKTLAIGSYDDTIQTWDFSDPNSVTLKGTIETGSGVNSLSFSPDGEILATVYSSGNEVYFWDISKPNSINYMGKIVGKNNIYHIAFSPFGRVLAIDEHSNIELYDVSDISSPEEIIKPLVGHKTWITALRFSPDGKTIASGDGDGSIILWDVTDQNLQQVMSSTYYAHANTVMSVKYRQDGKILATGGCDNLIRLWEVLENSQLKLIGEPLVGHTDFVYAIDFSPDGKLLASAGLDETIILWDVSDPTSPKMIGNPLSGHTERIEGLAFSPDGKVLVSGSMDNTIRIWNVSDPNSPHLFSEPLDGGGWVEEVAFSPDGKILATASWDNTIKLWDVTNPQIPLLIGEPLQGHTDGVLSLAFNPDGTILASGSSDDSIRLWDISNPEAPNQLGQPIIGYEDQVTSIAFSPDGKLLASSSYDNTVRLWDVSDPMRTQAIDMSLIGHIGTVLTVAFSPDGTTLASGSSDKTVRLWNMDVDYWKSQACTIVNRNLTYSEWMRYFPGKPYQFTCSYLPLSDALVREITTLAKDALEQEDRSTAELAYKEALSKLEGSDSFDYHNRICWLGSIDGFSEMVSSVCDTAVSLGSPDGTFSNSYDSRGLNRALRDDFDGAISDFQVFIDWSKENDLYDSVGKLREEWIAMMNEGVNPFDQETLNYLRTE